MARSTPAVKQPLPAPSSSDYLFLLRCDDVTASGMADVLGARTFSQINTPAQNPALFTLSTATTGSRDFNGSTQYGNRAAGDGDETIFQSLRWGMSIWVKPDTIGSVMGLFEYGEYDTGAEVQATNSQFTWVINANGTLAVSWERGAGISAAGSTTPTSVALVAGNVYHLGVAVEPDPDNLNKCIIRHYINGECVHVTTNHTAMDGGTSSRWIMAATRTGGSAVGTPGQFFDGKMDDCAFLRFTPDAAWFRWVYARGMRDFTVRDTDSRHFTTHARVLVEVGTSQFSSLNKVDLEWIDLTDINGIDFVKELEWSDEIDDFIQQATISCIPRFAFYNLSPFVPSAGGLNDNPLSAGTTPLLRSMRRIRIETAIVPPGMEKSQADPFFEVMFDGFIRAVDVTNDEVTVTAGDLGSGILDVWMEPNKDGGDRQYGSGAGTAVEGELQDIIDDNDPARFEILSIDDNGAGNKIVITLLATTASTDVNGRGRPHPFNVGDSVIVAGTVNYNTSTGAGNTDTIDSVTATTITLTRTTAGAFAAETVGTVQGKEALSYKGRKPTLYTPTSPSWNVFQWNEPASKGVLQALDDIMAQIGWRVAFRWHEARQQFRLTCYNPTQSFSNITLDPVMSVERMSMKIDDFRTPITVEYGSESTRDPANERTIFVVTAIDKTAVRDYGRRAGRVRVGSDSKITASGEAQELADTMNEDLSEPTAEMEVETLYQPLVETQDVVALLNEVLTDGQMASMFGSDIEGACTSVAHRIDNGKARTTVKLRNVGDLGTVSQSVSRVERHGEMFSALGTLKGRGLSAPVTPSAPTIRNLGTLNTLRTVIVEWTYPAADLNQAWVETEVHVSTTTGFTPSSSTLKHVVGGTSAAVSNLAATTTHYCKIVHRDKMGNRSAASAQTSFLTT